MAIFFHNLRDLISVTASVRPVGHLVKSEKSITQNTYSIVTIVLLTHFSKGVHILIFYLMDTERELAFFALFGGFQKIKTKWINTPGS